MGRLWKWLFVNRKAEALRREIDQLQSEMAEQIERQKEWRDASEAACRERDAARAEFEQTLSQERQKAAGSVSDLQNRIQQFETNMAVSRQKILQSEQVQASLNDLLKFRDQQIEEIQLTHGHETQTRETKIQILEQKLQDIELEMTTKLEASCQQVADMTYRSTIQDGELTEAVAKIQQLEQKLAASETHSELRAEQRSALLRNLTEIHRLSSLVTKGELALNSFKLVSSDTNRGMWQPELDSVSEPLPQFSSWNVYGDVESA